MEHKETSGFGTHTQKIHVHLATLLSKLKGIVWLMKISSIMGRRFTIV